MNNQWLVIKQLDKQFQEWQRINKKYGRPRSGWIKTLRMALSMSAEQLANRLGLSRARINQLEKAEIHDAVTLSTLKEAADALGCELVYAVVPKDSTTLEDIIKAQAERLAKERMARVSHTMSLEAQSLEATALKSQQEELTKILMEHLNKKFWSTPDNLKSNKQNELLQTLIKNLQKKK